MHQQTQGLVTVYFPAMADHCGEAGAPSSLICNSYHSTSHDLIAPHKLPSLKIIMMGVNSNIQKLWEHTYLDHIKFLYTHTNLFSQPNKKTCQNFLLNLFRNGWIFWENASHFHLKFNIVFPLIEIPLSMLLLYSGTLE